MNKRQTKSRIRPVNTENKGVVARGERGWGAGQSVGRGAGGPTLVMERMSARNKGHSVGNTAEALAVVLYGDGS